LRGVGGRCGRGQDDGIVSAVRAGFFRRCASVVRGRAGASGAGAAVSAGGAPSGDVAEGRLRDHGAGEAGQDFGGMPASARYLSRRAHGQHHCGEGAFGAWGHGPGRASCRGAYPAVPGPLHGVCAQGACGVQGISFRGRPGAGPTGVALGDAGGVGDGAAQHLRGAGQAQAVWRGVQDAAFGEQSDGVVDLGQGFV